MSYIQLFVSFLKVGALSFGGGYAAMPLIQEQVVNLHSWLSMSEFTNLITIAEMTPGPIAVNSATFVGIRIAGLPGAVRSAMEDQADLIIGGDTAVSLATQAGVPSLFLSMTEDSMRQAFSMAESMDYAMSVEKKTAAQIETISDYSFSGIMRMDADGLVAAVNPVMEDLFGKPQEKLCGQNVRTLLPSIGEEALRKVLGEGKDYSLTMEIGHVPLYVLLAPVLYESRVDGAIMSCHRVRRSVQVLPKSSEKERGQKGLPPLVRFDRSEERRVGKECRSRWSPYH